MSGDLKICVYGICKNESKLIDRWYKWAQKADYIRILDTGSTDDSVEKLSKLDKVEVHIGVISPWRFDVARNLSMKHIPEDADICCVADFDQIWVDGWDEELKRLFREGYNDISGDIIDYDDDGNEIKRFLSKNVHGNDPGWHWERPIHEGLHYNGTNQVRPVVSDKFIIEHHPDRTKSRNYLGLLELEYQENRTDPMCMIYYGCELSFHDRNEEAHEVFLRGLEECDFSDHPEVLYQTNINIAIEYKDRGEPETALKYALDAKNIGPNTRRVNYLLATIYNHINDYHNSIKYCIETLAVKYNLKDWREDVYLFSNPSDIYNLLAYNEFCLKDYYNAYLHQFIATTYSPDNETYKYNLNVYKEDYVRKYKVGFYAICKNESKNIDIWFATVKQADYVFVLDTGSTDDSVEKLKNLGVDVEIRTYEEFSFGKARQDALEIMLEKYPDIDICVTVDFDEYLRYDWYVKLQQEWDPDYDGMIVHGFNMDRTRNGDSNNKIHVADLNRVKWIRDIHEYIDYSNKNLRMSGISYIHNQDTTKNRNYYEYTKRAYYRKERSILDCVYFAWESRLAGNDHDAYDADLTAFSMFNEDKFYHDPSYNDKQLQANVAINLGTYCYREGSIDVAYSYFNIASSLDIGFDYRRIHCIKAFMLELKGDYEEALREYLTALKIYERAYCWIEDDWYYNNAYVELHLLKLLTEHFDAEELKEQIVKDAKEKYPDCDAIDVYINTGIAMAPRCELEV